jgi:spore coat polysaccharide biosynthesis protein SpsF (cytidylyltransferase family)
MAPKKKLGIFIPVRLESKRLKRKHIQSFYDITPLQILINNLSRIKNLKKTNIVVCSPNNKNNDKLKYYIKKIKCRFYQGSENNIIDRFYECNKKFKFDIIVEVDGDDVLTDPEIINNCILELNKSSSDVVLTKGLPIGLNCKVFNAKSLNYIHSIVGSQNNENGFMQYFYRSKKIKKKIIEYKSSIKNSRFTLDYQTDIEFVKNIYIFCSLLKLKMNIKNYMYLLKKFSFLKKINNQNNNLWNMNNKKMKTLKMIENKKTTVFKAG